AEKYPQLSENEVLNFMAIDDYNYCSILACVNNARENARGARDSLSAELWEEINKFYHNINLFTSGKLDQEGSYDFAKLVEENSSSVKGYIDNSLPRNEVWILLSLGLHLERAAQVLRILLSKLHDIEKVEPEKIGASAENYHVVTMLKSAESFDMSKRHYKSVPNRMNALEFLLFNQQFPKSVIFNLNLIQANINHLVPASELNKKGSLSFMVGKMTSNFRYLTISDIETDVTVFLTETLEKIYQIADTLEQKYLSY
ncbi:MAG: alpha-E domain-containing protein, partial [Bacteroidetes bacterium]